MLKLTEKLKDNIFKKKQKAISNILSLKNKELKKLNKELKKEGGKRWIKEKIKSENIKEIQSTIKLLEKEIKKIHKEHFLQTDKEIKKIVSDLNKNENIKKIECNEEIITINTTSLVTSLTKIGKHIITINFNKETIRIKRKDGKTFERGDNSRADHPFILRGTPCFGDKQKIINKAFNQGGIHTIVGVCMGLLFSVEGDGSGQYLDTDYFVEKMEKIYG